VLIMEEEYLTVEQVSELTGLDPREIRGYIRRGRLQAEFLGSVFDENYRVKRSSLMYDPELKALLRKKAGGSGPHAVGQSLPEEADLVKLVDRYKAMLDEISHYKMRAATLSASTGGKEKLKSELARKSEEAEELEREINRLRGKILAKEGEIRKLGRPSGDKGE
jgi:Helix-turn-helix domain